MDEPLLLLMVQPDGKPVCSALDNIVANVAGTLICGLTLRAGIPPVWPPVPVVAVIVTCTYTVPPTFALPELSVSIFKDEFCPKMLELVKRIPKQNKTITLISFIKFYFKCEN
jgi:uncharacterized protein (DUF697 family)